MGHTARKKFEKEGRLWRSVISGFNVLSTESRCSSAGTGECEFFSLHSSIFFSLFCYDTMVSAPHLHWHLRLAVHFRNPAPCPLPPILLRTLLISFHPHPILTFTFTQTLAQLDPIHTTIHINVTANLNIPDEFAFPSSHYLIPTNPRGS